MKKDSLVRDRAWKQVKNVVGFETKNDYLNSDSTFNTQPGALFIIQLSLFEIQENLIIKTRHVTFSISRNKQSKNDSAFNSDK